MKHKARHCNLAGLGKPRLGCHNKVFFRGIDIEKTDTGNFVLLHYQTLDFQDWLIHALRLSTDRKTNRFDLEKCQKYDDMPCHSCAIFRQFVHLNFSLYGMEELYSKVMCIESHLDAAGVTSMSC